MDGMNEPADAATGDEAPHAMPPQEAAPQMKICVVPLGDDTFKVYQEPYEAPAMEGQEGEQASEEGEPIQGHEAMLKAVYGMAQEMAQGPSADEQMNSGYQGEGPAQQ